MSNRVNYYDLNKVSLTSGSGVSSSSKNSEMDDSIFAHSSTDLIDPKKYFEIVLSYEDVIKEADINHDGKIDDAEKQTFIEKIKGNDGDKSSVSNKDIAMELEKILEKAQAEKEEQEEALAQEAGAEGAGGAAGAPSSEEAGVESPAGTADTAGTTGAPESSQVPEVENKNDSSKSLDDMTMEELQEEKENRETNLDVANDKLTEAQTAYSEAVAKDEQLTQELKERQEENQSAIDEKQGEIANTQNSIVEKEDAISDKESEISDLNSQIASLEQAANATLPPEMIENENGEMVENPEYAPAKEAKEQAQRDLDAKQEELEQAQDAWGALKNDLTTLENTLQTQQADLDDLEAERSQIEQEIMNSECSDEVKAALQALNKADQAQYDAQNNVYEVDRKIAQEKNNKTEEE